MVEIDSVNTTFVYIYIFIIRVSFISYLAGENGEVLNVRAVLYCLTQMFRKQFRSQSSSFIFNKEVNCV